jgi:hypothetical protein
MATGRKIKRKKGSEKTMDAADYYVACFNLKTVSEPYPSGFGILCIKGSQCNVLAIHHIFRNCELIHTLFHILKDEKLNDGSRPIVLKNSKFESC